MLTLVMALSFGLVGCGGAPDDGRLVVNVGPNPDTIDPALNSTVDGGIMIVHAFSGLTTWKNDAKGNAVVVNDCAETIDISEDGKVYTITLKDGLKWNNGEELFASDFEYAWKRAINPATGADYGYMFDVIEGYDLTDIDLPENKDYVLKHDINVVADDAAKTLVITLYNRTPYFQELLAFPTYMPVHKATVEAKPDTWATRFDTYVSNGAYKMTEWILDSKVVFEKNEFFHNADEVKIPIIEFALTDDDNASLANFNNETYKYIKNVPTDELERLKAEDDQLVIGGQIGIYYFNWNINVDLSPEGKTLSPAEQDEVRCALNMLLNRQNLVNLANGGQEPANSFVPKGLTEPDGSEFISNNGPNRDGEGYFDAYDVKGNQAKALETLTKYYDVVDGQVTNFPTVKILKNEGTGHEALAVAVQSDLAAVGIDVTLSTEEWGTFTNSRKGGDFMLARNGWLGDYNDPISFLDMWVTASGNNDVQFGKGAHADVAIYGENSDKTWAEAYNPLIAKIKAETDATKRFEMMHQAEDMLMQTGALMPFYYYTDVYMLSNDLTGVSVTPLGFKYFMYADLAIAE